MNAKQLLTTLARFALLTGILFLAGASLGSAERVEAAPAESGAMQSLGTLLQEDGSLDLSTGFSGTLDPAGWRMELSPSGEPRFVPESAPTGGETWDDRFGMRGVGCCTVYAVAVSGTDLYVAGNFDDAAYLDLSPAIVRWDGRRFWSLGEGLLNQFGSGGEVYDIAIKGGDVYVVGDFTTAGTAVANGVARWDGATWSAVGTGVGPTATGFPEAPHAIAILGDNIYIGGEFDAVDGVPARAIARWDGAAWSALGEGIGYTFSAEPAIVEDLAASGNSLYVGGYFNLAGEEPADAIARWDETTDSWSELGGGVTAQFGSARVRTVAAQGEDVYIGGDFVTAGEVSARYVAHWDGEEWNALGAGIGGGASAEVYSILIREDGVYVGGNFNIAGATPASNLARWDGGAWQAVGNAQAGYFDGPVRTLATMDGDLYAGGEFRILAEGTPDELAPNYVVRRSGDEWLALGQGVSSGGQCCGYINAVAISQDGKVYLGGYLFYAGSEHVEHIAMWDGSRWHALGEGTDDTVYALAAVGDDLFVGGTFTEAGGRSANHVARWNSATEEWSSLGSGVSDYVFSLAVEGQYLYVGGDFTAAGGRPADRVARWDRTTGEWSSLGERLEMGPAGGRIEAIATYGDLVFLGGSFSSVYLDGGPTAITVNSFIWWNSATDEWFRAAEGNQYGVTSNEGYRGTVKDIEVINGVVYVAGEFDKAGPDSAPGIASFDGEDWSALDSSVGGAYQTVYALASSGNSLYATGSFVSAGNETVNHVARWDVATREWTPLGVGLDAGADTPLNTVGRAIAAAAGDVWVAGEFATAGENPSFNVAHWSSAAPAATTRITPAAGGTLNQAGVTVQFPAGAVTEPVNLAFVPQEVPPHPAPGNQTIVRSFALEARADDGRIVSRFNEAYTLTVAYDGAALEAGNIDEASLNLAYWNGETWVSLLPCDGCTVDTENNRVIARLDHLTEFALMGEAAASAGSMIFMPVVIAR